MPFFEIIGRGGHAHLKISLGQANAAGMALAGLFSNSNMTGADSSGILGIGWLLAAFGYFRKLNLLTFRATCLLMPISVTLSVRRL